MKKYDIAHSELTNCYYIMCDGKKVAECTEQISNIRADAINKMIKAELHKDFCKEKEGPCDVTNNCTECRVKYLKRLKEQNND